MTVYKEEAALCKCGCGDRLTEERLAQGSFYVDAAHRKRADNRRQSKRRRAYVAELEALAIVVVKPPKSKRTKGKE